MMPGLGEQYAIDIEVIEKTREQYSSPAHAQTGLPVAPAVMIDNDVIVEKAGISRQRLAVEIERRAK